MNWTIASLAMTLC